MRLNHLIAAAVLAIGTTIGALSAHAALIGFNDVYEGASGFGTQVTNSTPLTFTHDITDDINPTTDIITFANLSIKVSDPFGGSEALTITLDFSSSGLGAIADGGPFTFFSFNTGSSILTLAMLQADGKLDVTLSVGSGQSLYFQRSDLSGYAETQVPEPASLALLGMGLFGLGMVRRRLSAKA